MFKRYINPIKNKILKIQYGSIVNADNIISVSKFRIWMTFKNEDYDIINPYLHNVINDWANAQEIQNAKFYKTLKKLIKKTGIELNDIERHNLFLVEERMFSIDRHIKHIDVNFELLPKETVGIKFTKASFFKKTSRLNHIVKGDLLVSNKRIIMDVATPILITFKEITSYSFKKYGFQFTTSSKETFVLRIHDQMTLNNTLKNLFTKKQLKMHDKVI